MNVALLLLLIIQTLPLKMPGTCPRVPTSAKIENIAHPPNLILGVPYETRPSYLFVEQNCKTKHRHGIDIKPGRYGTTLCIKIWQHQLGATTESCNNLEDADESLQLESAVMKGGHEYKCENKEIIEKVHVWPIEDLLVFWACEDLPGGMEHDEALLVTGWVKGLDDGRVVPVITSPDVVRKLLLNYTSNFMHVQINWECLDFQYWGYDVEGFPVNSTDINVTDMFPCIPKPFDWKRIACLCTPIGFLIVAAFYLLGAKRGNVNTIGPTSGFRW